MAGDSTPAVPVPAPGGGAALSGTRILTIMPSIPVQGMERSTLQIMAMLRRSGADVLFVTERRWGDAVRREVERIGCRWDVASFSRRLSVPTRPRDVAALARAWVRACRDVSRIRRAYGPTHIFVPDLAVLLYSLPVLWRAPQPVIFRLPNPPDVALRGHRRRVAGVIWRRCVPRVADVLVCNSEYARHRAVQAGIAPGRLALIHNCVAERAAATPSDAPRVERGRFTVVFLGRIRPEKGIRELVDAARRLIRERDDVDFYLAGEHRWQNPFADALIRELQADGLESRIRIVGEIADVFGLLDQCDLHVCPSRSAGESFPNVVLEAKRCGLPSVVFPVAGLPEAVDDRVDGYVCPEPTAAALYEGLRFFIDDRSRLAAAARAARASLERFSAERAATAWVSVVQRAARR